MKAIGIVGFKNSGKTTLALQIVRALVDKKYRVAVIKHSSTAVHQGISDTDKFLKETEQVVLVTPESTDIMMSSPWDLKRIISLITADFLVIEGFKSLKYFPKIICLNNEEEKSLLDDGLGIFSAGIDVSLKESGTVDFLINEKKDIPEMINQIEKKAFYLPDENCGKCGYDSCYELAKAIVSGKESIESCIHLQDFLSIKINGKEVFLNHFMVKLYQSLIYGMLAPLKNIDPLQQAEIEIKTNISGKINNKIDIE